MFGSFTSHRTKTCYWRYRVIFRSCQYLLHCYKDLIDLDYNIKMSLFEISESAENCSVELFLVYILTVSDYTSHRSLMEQIYDTPRKNIHLCPWSTDAVISSTGIFVAIDNNIEYGSTFFILCQKLLDIKIMFHEDILYCKYIKT